MERRSRAATGDPGHDHGPLDAGPLEAALVVARSAAEAREAALAGYGLDEGRLDVLSELWRCGPPHRLTAGELTRRCRVTPGATTQRLAGLERAGLVERVREAPDRRTVHVQLTDAGRSRHDEARDSVSAADEQTLAPLGALTPDERRQLCRALGHWVAGLTPPRVAVPRSV